MKKRGLLILSALTLTLCVGVLAAGSTAGTREDPLLSLSYLEGTFRDKLERDLSDRLDGAEEEHTPSLWREADLKEDDVLSLITGGEVLLLSGTGWLGCPAGTVVDVTAGAAVESGSSLIPLHRYLAAEDTVCSVLVTSKTAVAQWRGPVETQRAPGADYFACASALKTLGLFRGTGTGYGEGFDLEKTPNRVQALIMFIRLMGEEEEALAWTGTTPFADVTPGTQTERYVGYAWERGYTNGYTATEFRPGQEINAAQYTEFLLRAMGYSVPGGAPVSTALARAREQGVITPGEEDLLSRESFLRAELAYLSYYALPARLSDGETLAEHLRARGVFTREQWSEAMDLDVGTRY